MARLRGGQAGVRLTTMHVDKRCRLPSQRTPWPFGHLRGGLNPVPAAQWVGAPQVLRANAPEKHFKPGVASSENAIDHEYSVVNLVTVRH